MLYKYHCFPDDGLNSRRFFLYINSQMRYKLNFLRNGGSEKVDVMQYVVIQKYFVFETISKKVIHLYGIKMLIFDITLFKIPFSWLYFKFFALLKPVFYPCVILHFFPPDPLIYRILFSFSIFSTTPPQEQAE